MVHFCAIYAAVTWSGFFFPYLQAWADTVSLTAYITDQGLSLQGNNHSQSHTKQKEKVQFFRILIDFYVSI
jgi:hypothetical protein